MDSTDLSWISWINWILKSLIDGACERSEHQSHEVTMINPESKYWLNLDEIVKNPIQMDFNKVAAKLVDILDPINPT